MRVGLLSDIHANLVALEAVFEDMPPVDALVCAGDVVGYNPWPAECVDAMIEWDVPTVMGNHDRAVVRGTEFRFNETACAGVEYARNQLTVDRREWLAELPDDRYCFGDRVRVVHGHPDDPDRYTYPQQFGPELLGEADVLVLGHTHVQGHEVYEEGIVCNPGSVGQPRDGDPRAAYAVLDLDRLEVERRRIEYDVDAVAEAIEDAGLPRRSALRLAKGQ